MQIWHTLDLVFISYFLDLLFKRKQYFLKEKAILFKRENNTF